MLTGKQKEVVGAFLDGEKKVTAALEKNYAGALADIKRKIKELQASPESQSKAYQITFQQQLEKQVSGILNDLQKNNYATVEGHLLKSYQDGYIGTMYDLQSQGVPLVMPLDQNQVAKAVYKTSNSADLADELGFTIDDLNKQVLSEIQRGLATDMSYSDIGRNISNRSGVDMRRSQRIARTEGHRVQNEAKMDSLHGAKDKGARIIKQWDSTLDGATRDTHRKLDGQEREIDEAFEMDGLYAMYPGDFGDPSEDQNCRCAMLQRAEWAKDEGSYEKWNNETGGFIETTGYDDFREKYLEAEKKMRTDVDAHMIKVLGEYTDGKYRNYCGYSQYLADGSFGGHSDEFVKTLLANVSEAEKADTERLLGIIRNQDVSDVPIVRLEKNGWETVYQKGDEIDWGIRSATQDTNFAQKVWDGLDKGITIEEEHSYVEFVVQGDKKFFDIAKYSNYDQSEVLLEGKFRVVGVDTISAKDIIAKQTQTFSEIEQANPSRFEAFTSKKGKAMVRDTETGVTKLAEQWDIEVFYKGKEMSYYEIVAKEEKIFSRQIVTIEQVIK